MASSDGSNHSSTKLAGNNRTYEAIHASLESSTLPDPIAWESSWSFRQQSYRHLHHQQGVIGHVRVRLFEGKDLKRVGWSVLGLGPVKLLGLSKAVGEVSSFASFWLEYETKHSALRDDDDHTNAVPPAHNDGVFTSTQDGDGSKMPGKRTPEKSDVFTSSIVPNSNNPIWNIKSNSSFDIPIRKGSMRTDGMSITLRVRMEEDRSAAEALLPGGIGGTGDGALLGQGSLELTEFLLNGDAANTGTLESWIDLRRSAPDDDDDDEMDADVAVASLIKKRAEREDSKKSVATRTPRSTGKIRVQVSYEPNGMEPQTNDICSLECFARRPVDAASCPTILHPLQPMRVVDVRDPFLLLQYKMPCSSSNKEKKGGGDRTGTIKLHRNTVFVVERQTLSDLAVNTMMSPVDVVMSHPLGEETVRQVQPYVETVGEVAEPLVASGKLMLGMLKTGAGAGLAGIGTVAKVMVDNAIDGVEQKKYRAQRQQQQRQG